MMAFAGTHRITILFAIATMMLWASVGMTQTEWVKHPGNPVLDLGPEPWDDERVISPTVLSDGTEYKMWYAGYDGSLQIRIGYATSQDGMTWDKHPDNPVLNEGPSGAWDDYDVTNPTVLFDGIYKMWYAGYDGSLHIRIGYATSQDGMTWDKHPDNPVLDLGENGTWDDLYVTCPTVLFDGTEYKMWYTGDDGSNERIGLATSTDGIVWEKYHGNPVVGLGTWDWCHVGESTVLFESDDLIAPYKMWYGGHNCAHWKIGYATSSDGIAWDKCDAKNPVLDLGEGGAWDDVDVHCPTVSFFDGVYKMWYSGHDGSHWRIGYATSQADQDLRWAFNTGDAVFSSPAIGADGTVYVGSNDNNLYAINSDGTQKWAFTADDWVYSSPAIGADGTVYVGSHDNKLYAINPDGTEKWAFTTDNIVYSSPAIGADGTVYVGSYYGNKLYAINPDGTEKWAFTIGDDGVTSSPAIGADGTVYVGSLDCNLYAINPDGSQKWAFTTGDYVVSSPAIGADGTVYVGSWDYYLYAINPDGSQKWAFTTTGEYIYSSPAIGADGTVYVGAGASDNKLYAINPDGSQKWAFTTGNRVYSSPAIGADGTVYVGSDDTNLYAIEGSSGGLADTPWPMFRHDLKHTGRVECSGPCCFTVISSGAVDELRQFRDKLLARNEAGQQLTQLYYQHSPEVASILLSNPTLVVRSAAILKDMMPGIRLLLGNRRGRDIVMTPLRITRVTALFRDIGEEGSKELSQTLSMLSDQLSKYKGMRISRIWQAIGK